MKPLILIVNDDGVRSPGLRALAETAAQLGDVLISAPARQQTAMSRALAFGPGVGRIERHEIRLNGGTHPAYGVHATPATAAAHGILELADRMPALCLSGINYGENIGFSLTRSGTIGAALEAASFGIPAIAVSLETSLDLHFSDEYPDQEWAVAQQVTRDVAARVLTKGMPAGAHVLNINVPNSATPSTPVRWTRHSRHNYYSYLDQPERDLTADFRLHEDRIAPPDLETDSDVYAFAVERAISVTPLAGVMTAHGYGDGWWG